MLKLYAKKSKLNMTEFASLKKKLHENYHREKKYSVLGSL